VSGLVVRGIATSAPDNVAVRTFLEDGAARFASQGKRSHATELVIHETVTRSVDSTIAVLKKRGLSVHLVLGPDGELTQHGDLVSDVLWHAGPAHNGPSFGVEVVNPYYPRLLRKGLPWERTIKAPWAHEGQYVLPTPAQAEAVASLVRWTTSAPAPGLEVPRRWVGLRAGIMQLGPVAEAVKATPGVLAHHYFGHADGAWLVLYAWLRLEAGLSPETAFDEAARRATGARRSVDVRDLLAATPVA
jgi:hypothetical protein